MSFADDRDRFVLIDVETEVHLASHGLPGFTVAETIDRNGERQAWIVDRHQLDAAEDHRDVDHGAVDTPEHEELGTLSAQWADRIRSAPIRCGARCANGHPCRIEVREPGHACGWHRRAVR